MNELIKGLNVVKELAKGHGSDKIVISKTINGDIDRMEFPNITVSRYRISLDTLRYYIFYKGEEVENKLVTEMEDRTAQRIIGEIVENSKNVLLKEWESLKNDA